MVMIKMKKKDISMHYRNMVGIYPSTSALHVHDGEELLLVLTGVSRIVTEKRVERCSGSFIIFYPMGVPHTQFSDADKPYERYCMQYKPDAIANLLPPGLLPRTFFVLPLTHDETEQLLTYVRPLKDACEAEDSPTIIRRRKLLLALVLNELAPLVQERLPEAELTSENSSLIADICMYISEHFAEPLTLDALARQFFISRSKLVRSFRSALDTTVLDYITAVRVSHSKEMLHEGMSVQETAHRCGFADVGYYIKIFRKATGTTPAKFRKTAEI